MKKDNIIGGKPQPGESPENQPHITVENAVELINEFFSKISHEIRTPVNALQQAARQLESELQFFNNNDITRLTTIMVEDSERLARTVDLLVNFAMIRSGTYKVKKEKFDLFQEVLTKIVASRKTFAEKKGLRFLINSSTLNTEVVADVYSVTHILSNIIDNAVLFTKEGMIEIEITRLTEGNLIVSIIDSGIGIDPGYINEVFNPFSQESKGYTREYDGIGLGLPVAKGFCELNNIELKISSQKYAGTVVSLKFEV